VDLSSLETVSPNPTVFNYGEEDSANDLSSIASIASSWGATIADIASGNTQQSPTYVVQSRVATAPATTGTSTILLLVVAAAVIYMIVRK